MADSKIPTTNCIPFWPEINIRFDRFDSNVCTEYRYTIIVPGTTVVTNIAITRFPLETVVRLKVEEV